MGLKDGVILCIWVMVDVSILIEYLHVMLQRLAFIGTTKQQLLTGIFLAVLTSQAIRAMALVSTSRSLHTQP